MHFRIFIWIAIVELLSLPNAYANLKRSHLDAEEVSASNENSDDDSSLYPIKAPRVYEEEQVPEPLSLDWECSIFLNPTVMDCLYRKVDISDVLRLSALNRTMDNALKHDDRLAISETDQTEKRRFFGFLIYLIKRDCRKLYSYKTNPLKALCLFMGRSVPIEERIRNCYFPFKLGVCRCSRPKCLSICFFKNVKKELNPLLLEYPKDTQERIERIIVRNVIRRIPRLHERADSSDLLPFVPIEVSEIPEQQVFDHWVTQIKKEIHALDLPYLGDPTEPPFDLAEVEIPFVLFSEQELQGFVATLEFPFQ